jgi:hypothetical protein
MVTSKKLKLKEDWKSSILVKGKTKEIFVNPSWIEMKKVSVGNELRYIIDLENKKLYVFSPEVLHISVAKELGIPYKFDFSKHVFGVGNISMGKLSSDNRLKKINKKYDWLWKYFHKPKKDKTKSLKEMLDEAIVSNAAENLDWIYRNTKDLKNYRKKIKDIIFNWATELWSKKGTGATSHKDLNLIAAMVQYATLYVDSKLKNDIENEKVARRFFERVKNKILEKFK